ncbi:MAG: hypothetical protein VX871_05180, partial [Pseudomonadota bacterium]|nr:hypothetical protein [Pseudomonadota bacterium]
MPRFLKSAIFLTLVLAVGARASDWQVELVDVPSAPVRMFFGLDNPGLGSVRIEARDGKWFYLENCGERVCAKAFTDPYRAPAMPPGALPDGRLASGRLDIRAAWYAKPTNRYGHGVLGDAIEAEALVVENEHKKRFTLELGLDS